jgi:uncharacterized protein
MNTRHLKRIAIALAIIAFVAAGVARAQDAKPFLGAWKGTISVAGAQLEIGLNFKLDEAQKITGTFDSITQGAFGLALDKFEIKDKTISFMISGVPGDPLFKGTLDETGKKLSGEFSQGGYVGTFAVVKQ